MKQRREIEGVSLAFLDVISCGFGAIILMLVLTKVFEPVILEDTIENLEGYLAALQEDIFDIRGETRDLNREMIRKEDRKKEEIQRLSKLQQSLQALNNQFENTSDKTKIDNLILGRLAKAKQSLTEEMQRLLADFQKDIDDDTIGGIPVDSEYLIFIVDTSGSMKQFAWPRLVQQVEETLAVYPRLKGIQVMNDMGNFMFSQYANDWIPDTQARRRAILDRLKNWDTFSNSSPVEGITKAISTFYRPDRKISLYVLGDEFSGRSIQRVVSLVDQINRVGRDGKRLVRIHAIGFPVIFSQPVQFQATGIRFAILMRELCARNGGTFVALNDYRIL
ncbi:MAG: VWA domain-containing protein [bacterium]|nr:VWA domain-containing protein [Gammaproteobacteria bacterium]HIL96506.1 VWA domain-containing protein [Pseudomonadales bacterium]